MIKRYLFFCLYGFVFAAGLIGAELPFGQALYEAYKFRPLNRQETLDVELFNAVKELSEKFFPFGKDALKEKIARLKQDGANIDQVLVYAIVDGTIPLKDVVNLGPKNLESYEQFQKALKQEHDNLLESLKNIFSHSYSDKLVETALQLGAHANAVDRFSKQSALQIATEIYMGLYMLVNAGNISASKKLLDTYEKVMKLLVKAGADVSQIDPIFKKFWQVQIDGLNNRMETIRKEAPAKYKDYDVMKEPGAQEKLAKIAQRATDRVAQKHMKLLEGLNKKLNIEIKSVKKSK